jgi:hypothetical protein
VWTLCQWSPSHCGPLWTMCNSQAQAVAGAVTRLAFVALPQCCWGVSGYTGDSGEWGRTPGPGPGRTGSHGGESRSLSHSAHCHWGPASGARARRGDGGVWPTAPAPLLHSSGKSCTVYTCTVYTFMWNRPGILKKGTGNRTLLCHFDEMQ